MKTLLQSIITYILTLTDNNGDTLIKYCKEWNEQYSDIIKDKDVETMFPMPAAFIEYEAPEGAVQLGAGVQSWDPLNITLHILHWQLDAGGGDMEQNLEVYDLVAAIHLKMQLYSSNGCVPMVCVEQSPDIGHGNVRHFTLKYKTNLIDSSTVLPIGGIPSNAPLAPVIELSVEGSTDSNEPYIYP